MFGKNTLILGFGREGVSTLTYLLSHPDQSTTITIYDEHELTAFSDRAQTLLQNNPQVQLLLGKPLSTLNFDGYDRIVKSPGIPNKDLPQDIWPKITSQTQIFFDKCPAQIIGVTGTKGKSTTASLIHAICSNSGKRSVLLGNIGLPPLDYLDDTNQDSQVVFELSSHQLSHLTKSPHIAVLLAIFPEHLDYYRSMDEYVAAKSTITKFQSKDDYLIYNSENKFSQQIADRSHAHLIPVSAKDIGSAKAFLSDTGLRGEMNAINIATAIQVAKILNIKDSVVRESVKDFHPLAHRLEKVGTYQGIAFYNDSLSTIPQATIAALNTLGAKVSTLILGGYERNLSYQVLAADLLTRDYVKNLIFFPTTGKKIWNEIINLDSTAQTRFNLTFVDNMPEAVNFAYKHTKPGEICLLSPGATSFETFKDYQDRGDQFRNQVQKLSA